MDQGRLADLRCGSRAIKSDGEPMVEKESQVRGKILATKAAYLKSESPIIKSTENVCGKKYLDVG